MEAYALNRTWQRRSRAADLLRRSDPYNVLKEGTVAHLVALAAIEEALITSTMPVQAGAVVDAVIGGPVVGGPVEYACVEAFVRIQERHALCAGMGEWRRMSYARAREMARRGEAGGLRHEICLVTNEKGVLVNKDKVENMRRVLHAALARLPLACDEADDCDRALTTSLRALLSDIS